MRILMLSWEYPPRIVGGISRVVYELSRALVQNGAEVFVVTLGEDTAASVSVEDGITVIRCGQWPLHQQDFHDWVKQFNYMLAAEAIKAIRDHGPFDVIHAHDWLVAFSAMLIKDTHPIPMIVTMHSTETVRAGGMLVNDQQRFVRDLEKLLMQRSDKIIVNSQFMRSEVIYSYEADPDKITVIHNGIDCRRFENETSALPEEFLSRFALRTEKIVLFVGRLVMQKGIEYLIDAMPQILNHRGDAKLVIVGKGPDMGAFQYRSRALGLGEKVLFTGYMPDEELARLYKIASVAVFPSVNEPFGLVALEAMCQGVPVVVSDSGGFKEIVSHGITGYKAGTASSTSIADAVVSVLNHPDLAMNISRKAQVVVRQNYCWCSLKNDVLKVYHSITAQEKSGTR